MAYFEDELFFPEGLFTSTLVSEISKAHCKYRITGQETWKHINVSQRTKPMNRLAVLWYNKKDNCPVMVIRWTLAAVTLRKALLRCKTLKESHVWDAVNYISVSTIDLDRFAGTWHGVLIHQLDVFMSLVWSLCCRGVIFNPVGPACTKLNFVMLMSHFQLFDSIECRMS